MAEDEQFEVVISGIGGKFPDSDNLEELKANLFGKLNMISVDDRRWLPGQHGTPEGLGKVRNVEKFDTNFFGIHHRLCLWTDPLVRQLLERTFEAVIDSGNNLKTFQGKNIGVFTASAVSESESFGCYAPYSDGLGIVGNNKSMLANRISFFFNFNGPSYNLSTTWVGGLETLRLAKEHIANGHIEAAVVGVVNLHMYPNLSVESQGLGMLCSDGKCCSFDAEASGYPRSEAVVAFFLQRKIDAKRDYGTIIHVKTSNFGSRETGFLHYDENIVIDFLKEFYSECKVDPSTIAYVEADGSAVQRTEIAELNSLSNVLCEGKSSPLLIGSIKSNLGHTESSAGLVGIVKAIIAMDSGVIPPNIHYNTPNPQIPALNNGKLKVVSNPEELSGDLVAINGMSFSGDIGHVLLRRNSKVKKRIFDGTLLPKDGLPRLILASGRHYEAVTKIQDLMKNMKLDPEFAALINNVHKENITGHMYRIFQILPIANELDSQILRFSDNEPNIWFVFSGMGSQWNGMGVGLMKFPVFANAIEKCNEILTPLDIDIKYVLTSMDKPIFENILNCFVGIAAVQIGLVNLLKSLSIEPNGFIGHSVGELGCAYADGCLTAEQMILSAYYRGRTCLEIEKTNGMMAAVGLGYQSIKHRLPENVEVACHNAKDICTITGPVDDVRLFVKQLKSEGVFVASVNVAGFAFHSRHISSAGPILLKRLTEIIKHPKHRSSKWISSSAPENSWKRSSTKFCSPAYLVNNLLSPVLFEEACKHVPAKAVVIEIGPHGLLQTILRRVIPSAANISLTSKFSDCNVRYFLAAVGRMYLNSALPDVNKLYPLIEYPVSRGTPGISQLISWDHTEDWPYGSQHKAPMVGGEEEIDIVNSEQNPELGQLIHNLTVIPVSVLLVYVWKKFAAVKYDSHLKSALPSVVFEEVKISNHVVVSYMGRVKLHLMVHRAFGGFVMNSDEGKPVISGTISLLHSKHKVTSSEGSIESVSNISSYLYNLLESRGCVLNDYYKAIKTLYVTNYECSGEVLWSNDWLPFLDSMFRVNIFLGMEDCEGVLEPTFIQRLSIDTSKFSSLPPKSLVPFRQINATNFMRCGGVELLGVELALHAGPIPLDLKIEKVQFVPHIANEYEINRFLSIVLQVVAESNLMLWKNRVVHLIIIEMKDKASKNTELLTQNIQNVLDLHFNIQVQTKIVKDEDVKTVYLEAPNTFHIVLCSSSGFSTCVQQFDDDRVFFLTHYPETSTLLDETVITVLKYKIDLENFVLLKKNVNFNTWNVLKDIVGSDWLLQLRSQVLQIKNEEPIIVCWDNRVKMSVSLICEIVSKESYAQRLRCIFLLDKNVPKFNTCVPYYSKQLSQGLAVNVSCEGMWGSFRKLVDNNIHQSVSRSVDYFNLSLKGLNVKYFGLDSQDFNESSVSDNNNNAFNPLNLEYSGVNNSGGKVMGLAQGQLCQGQIIPDKTMTWIVPEYWSLEDAVTVPLVYTTAYYALKISARLEHDETILIHPGDSPLGEAAIAIALGMGGDVFTTVSNNQQVSTLINRFPSLKLTNIFEESNFNLNLLLATNGKGVAVVINTVEKLGCHQSLQCLRENGRFVQLGQMVMKEKEKIGMKVFLNGSILYGVSSSNIFHATQDLKNMLREIFQNGVNKGLVKPFNRKVFSKHQYNESVSYKKENFQEKVIISMEQIYEYNKKQTRFLCETNEQYLIVGTNIGLCLELIEWFLIRGARQIVVALENKSYRGFDARKFINLITRYNPIIKMISTSNIESKQGALKLLKEIVQIGSVAAIFNIMLDANKVKNVDLACRLFIPELRHFVCIFGDSSEVCYLRRQSGHSGLSIQCDGILKKSNEVFNYLQQLLEGQDDSHFVLINDHLIYNKNKLKDQHNLYKAVGEYLPTKPELFDFGSSLIEMSCFEEVTTLSPRKKFVKSKGSVFLFPGLKQSYMQSLIAKLLYPGFCLKLSQVWKTVEETACDLVANILTIDDSGPYTLVSETWSGALALEVGCKLEKQGFVVVMVLLDAAPSVTQMWANAIGHLGSQTFDENLLTLLLNLNSEVRKEICQANSWAEKILSALKSEEKHKRENIGLALTHIRSKLTTLLSYKPSGQLFKGEVHLVRQKSASSYDFCKLFLYCGRNVKIYTINDATTHAKLVASSYTASIVNDNTAHCW